MNIVTLSTNKLSPLLQDLALGLSPEGHGTNRISYNSESLVIEEESKHRQCFFAI